jgi:hypothetical protein
MRLFTRHSAGFLFLAAVILTTGSARAQRKQAGPRKSTSSSGLNPEEMQIIRKMVAMDSARLSALFIDLHQNPELGFMEVRTSGIVAKELNALGYDVKTNIGKTGVVGILKNGAGPIVMYRGDMDCNAMMHIPPGLWVLPK